jgi:hypothetical protein
MRLEYESTRMLIIPEDIEDVLYLKHIITWDPMIEVVDTSVTSRGHLGDDSTKFRLEISKKGKVY